MLAGDEVSPVKISHDQNLSHPSTQGCSGLVRGVGTPVPPGVLPGNQARGWVERENEGSMSRGKPGLVAIPCGRGSGGVRKGTPGWSGG